MACEQTLSVGGDIAAAVSSAANNSEICLNAGTYGALDLTNISRTGFVTVKPVTGATVTIGFNEIWNCQFIRFQGLRITHAAVMLTTSHHIEFIDCVFVPDGNGLVFNSNTDTPPATSQNFIVDGCDFTDAGQALFDGRLCTRGTRGCIIRNCLFTGVSEDLGAEEADGIMIVGGSTDITIGPGNIFHTIHQADAALEHVDSIQLLGAGANNRIVGNYFYNSDVFVLSSDGGADFTILEDNVFDGRNAPGNNRIQFGSTTGTIFRHNTVRDTLISFDSKIADPASEDVLAENNVMIDSTFTTASGNGCIDCTFTNNLYTSAGDAVGSNNIIGTPTFVGGTNPTTYAGFALASGSAGENVGNDGQDVGILLDEEPPPEPPTDAVSTVAAVFTTIRGLRLGR